VFLTQRHTNAIVKSILEQEGKAGGAALAATDVVLQNEQSSLASDYALFADWNAATGARAAADGYANAANYPLATLAELTTDGAQGITSGLASFYYHVNVSSPVTVTITTDAARNAASLVPLQNGIPQLDKIATLPAELDDEGIVVVSGITTDKSDAPFTLSLPAVGASSSSPSSGSSGGCAVVARGSDHDARDLAALPFLGFLALVRRRRSRSARVRVARF
jgi:MYXO-CTERM domain-containing protein